LPAHKKPTLIRKLEGNPAKRPLNNREPEPVGPAVMPDFLDGEAAAEWDRAIAAMPPGLYTTADVPAMTVHCLAWSIYRDAWDQVQEYGLTTVGSQGQPVVHPAVMVMTKQAEVLTRNGEKLGMSPVARSRIEFNGPPKESDFDQMSRPPIAANG
jgi:P27 family predicted phage terminase small subunit